MRVAHSLLLSALLVLFAAAAAVGSGPLPKVSVLWNTSLNLGFDEGLVQLTGPHAATNHVYVSDTFNVYSINRHTGAFVATIPCSENGNCDPLPGGSTTGDLVVASNKNGTIRAWDANGTLVWTANVACQASAFQGVKLSRAADDGSIFVSCVNTMSPVLLSGATGEVLATAARYEDSRFYQTMSPATFVPADAATQRPALWIWSGAAETVAFAHPSLKVVWRQPAVEYASRQVVYSLKLGRAFLYGDNNQVTGLDLGTGNVVFAVNSMCNNGVALFSDKYLTCLEPYDGLSGQVQIHSAQDGRSLANISLTEEAFGGCVPVPGEPDLVAIALANDVAIASLQTGRYLSRTKVNSYQFSTGGSNFGDHVFDGVAYMLTPASVMAIDFKKQPSVVTWPWQWRPTCGFRNCGFLLRLKQSRARC